MPNQLVKVEKSPIHGMGCYAVEPIACDQIIIEYVGEPIDYAEAIRRDDKNHPDHSEYILSVDDKLFIDGSREGNESRFVNHSCEPNCTITVDNNRAFYVAIRPIAPGEELTYDYLYDPEYREPCACGATSCRGYI